MEKRLLTWWRIGLIGVFAASVLLYLPSLMGGAIWDDFDLISGAAFGKNTYYSAFNHAFLGHYFRPLTSASFVFDSTFAKATPFFYHQTNILIHSITAVLVACLTFLCTKKQVAGILAGLFFAAQPMQVGAAAWIGGRTDVMSAMFLAAFMVCLVLYHQSTKKGWLVLSVLTYFLAGISKEQALAVLPAVALSIYIFGSKKGKDALKLCIPYLLSIAVVIVMWIIDAPAPSRAPNSFPHTITLALRSAAHYGLAFFAPNNHSLLTWTLESYRGPLWILTGAALVSGGIAAFIFCWKKNRPVAWLAVCGLLVYLPVSNFPVVPSFVAGPYRVAEPGTAVACLLGACFAWALTLKRWPVALLCGLNLIAGTMVTWTGIHLWADSQQFFSGVAHTDPHFIVGVGNYAQGLNDSGKPEESLKWTNGLLTWIFHTKDWRLLLEKQKLKALTPEVNLRLRTNGGNPDMKALGWFVGVQASSYSRLKDTFDAVEVEKVALLIAPSDARLHFAYGQLIVSFDRKEAIEHWEYALVLLPHYAVCAAALAHERIIDGRYSDAVKLLEEHMGNLGWNSSAWIDLADAKIGMKDYGGATRALDSADRAIFVKKDLIDLRRKRIKALTGTAKQSPPAQIKKSK